MEKSKKLLVPANCEVCGTKNRNMYYCSKCKSIKYCSVECQRADWKKHKPVCDPSYLPQENLAKNCYKCSHKLSPPQKIKAISYRKKPEESSTVVRTLCNTCELDVKKIQFYLSAENFVKISRNQSLTSIK